jgi:hypothetical protein
MAKDKGTKSKVKKNGKFELKLVSAQVNGAIARIKDLEDRVAELEKHVVRPMVEVPGDAGTDE